jgi:DNA-binding response OmpR family regulator
VLVVDDDAEMRAVVRRTLENAGHVVREVARGDGVEEALRTGAADALILDEKMPGRSGLDVLASVRRAYPALPVVLITAFGGAVIERRALELGATRYLEKPFSLRRLVDLLRELGEAAAPAS